MSKWFWKRCHWFSKWSVKKWLSRDGRCQLQVTEERGRAFVHSAFVLALKYSTLIYFFSHITMVQLFIEDFF